MGVIMNAKEQPVYQRVARKILTDFGLPRVIILSLFVLLFILAGIYNMDLPSFMGDVLRRWGMFGILVLAMVPGIQSGIGPNFGVTVGIVGGLLGAVLSMELRFRGWFDAFIINPVTEMAYTTRAMSAAFTSEFLTVAYTAEYAAAARFIAPVVTQVHGYDAYGLPFVVTHVTAPMVNVMGLAIIATAILIGGALATGMGVLYGMLLNRVKGSEMAVSVYVGFSAVAVFNILWALIPVRNSIMILPATGRGLRQMINLQDDFGGAFDNLFTFTIGTFTMRTGLLLIFFVCCLLMWVFTKSRLGMMMSAAGSNPSYARASGINVEKMRILGTAISTALGAVGIIIFAQSFGFLQMYNAPLMMGFTTVASVLIGGATVKRARVFDVLLGAFLFNGILTIALPLANVMLPDVAGVPEMLRLIITNGIILYALTKVKGGV